VEDGSLTKIYVLWEQTLPVALPLQNFDPLSTIECTLLDDTGEDPEVVGTASVQLWELMPEEDGMQTNGKASKTLAFSMNNQKVGELTYQATI
jgi:hypothetical protein